MAIFKPPGQCPVCHEFVQRKALSCPDCGACAKSGWNEEDGIYDGLDLPDDDFDYTEFTAKEFGGACPKPSKPWWWYIALVLIFIYVVTFVMHQISIF